jgi:heme-degrading monooxygenase HmoA
MPIATIYEVKGGTLAQYDAIIEGLGEHAQSPGGLAHIAAETPYGFFVCDVWESMEAYQSFEPHLTRQAEAAGLEGKATPVMGRVERVFVSESANALPAVAVIYDFKGLTVERYHEVLSHVRFGDVSPEARRAHIASDTGDGIFVAAVWESEAAFRAFEPALHAAFAVASVDAPAPLVVPIHKVMFSPAAAQSAHA